MLCTLSMCDKYVFISTATVSGLQTEIFFCIPPRQAPWLIQAAVQWVPWTHCPGVEERGKTESWMPSRVIMPASNQSQHKVSTAYKINDFNLGNPFSWRSLWPSCLKWKSAATRLLRLRVLIPPGVWMVVLCVLRWKTKGKMQDNQNREPSTHDVQSTRKYNKNSY
jgi:hypothetical protein